MSYVLTEAEELREALAELANDLQYEAEQMCIGLLPNLAGDRERRLARVKVDASERILALLAGAPTPAPEPQ